MNDADVGGAALPEGDGHELDQSRLRNLRNVMSGEFTAALVRGQGVQGIAAVLHRRTRLPVVVQDTDGRVIAFSPPVDPTLDSEIEDLSRPGLPGDASDGVASRDTDRWVVLACLDSQVFGAISLVDEHKVATETDLFALEQAATILAMELLRKRSVAETELAVWGDFITELLENPDAAQVRSHARSLGYDLDRTYRVVLVKPPGPAPPELLAAARRAARWLGLGECMTTIRPEGVVMLVADDVDWTLLGRLVVTNHDRGVRIGVGGRYDSEELSRSLVDAQLALSLTKSVLGKPVAVFDDLGVWSLLARVGARELQDLVDQSIGPLVEYDRDHHSELVKTLSTYLNEGGSAEAVAAKLFIHRNTLNYRLSRVKDLTGFNLSDPDLRFQLQLACRAWVVLRVFGESRQRPHNVSRPNREPPGAEAPS